MAKFRKRPVVIEAIELGNTYRSDERVERFNEWAERNGFEQGRDWWWQHGEVHIPTLEGEMIARPGDWIVKGVEGEFYPVKTSIFLATYEEVDA